MKWKSRKEQNAAEREWLTQIWEYNNADVFALKGEMDITDAIEMC